MHTELRTAERNTLRGCLKAIWKHSVQHMFSQSRLLRSLARRALSIFKYADFTYFLDTCSHTVKPDLWWKWFSKTIWVSCVPPSACFLLHDHSAPWRRGWAHLMSKYIKNINQAHPKEELFWCIQIRSLKVKLEVGSKSISWVRAMNFFPQGIWTNP